MLLNKSHTLYAPLALLALSALPAQADTFGPANYRCFDSTQISGCLNEQQSPFSQLTFAYFYLEDFEDAMFNVPGITPVAGNVFMLNNLFQDSVDEDDGVIDGINLQNNASFGISSGAPTIALNFDDQQLGGRLPTHVGLALVNNFNDFTFRAFNADGLQVDEVNGSTNFVANGSALDDNFMGISHDEGIASVSVSGSGGGMEIDHIQYGFACGLVAGEDSDADGILDAADNCTFESNPSQTDSDGDGFGNACDTDLNNDGVTNFIDLSTFVPLFLTTNPDADFNSDGVVNFLDLNTIRRFFLTVPGPVCSLPSRDSGNLVR
ncbi:MAG: thrombospondin type 3 repeat-containing protein [Gammaproteobacteria bacterium]